MINTFSINGIILSAKLSPLGVPKIVLTTLPAVSAVSPLKAAETDTSDSRSELYEHLQSKMFPSRRLTYVSFAYYVLLW